jgi:hypothetical protein
MRPQPHWRMAANDRQGRGGAKQPIRVAGRYPEVWRYFLCGEETDRKEVPRPGCYTGQTVGVRRKIRRSPHKLGAAGAWGKSQSLARSRTLPTVALPPCKIRIPPSARLLCIGSRLNGRPQHARRPAQSRSLMQSAYFCHLTTVGPPPSVKLGRGAKIDAIRVPTCL